MAAQGKKSKLQKKKDQYANTALSGQRYDSEEDAEFEPEVETPQSHSDPAARKVSGSSLKDDEWSHLEPQRTVPGQSQFYTNEELDQMDRQSESSEERSRKVCLLLLSRGADIIILPALQSVQALDHSIANGQCKSRPIFLQFTSQFRKYN